MRAGVVFTKTLMWIVLVLCTGIHALAIIGIGSNNARAREAEQLDKVYALWPLIALVVLIWAAVLLFTFWKKRAYIGLIVAGIAGIAAIVLAFDLMRAFPSQITSSGEAGLSTWKMVYRHMSPVLIPLLMVPAFICDRIASKQEQALLVAAGKARFDLSGAPIFSDASTLGLATAAEGPVITNRREKRSVRAARRKRERY